MQWTSGTNAGFCPEGVEPWLPIPEDHAAVSVDAQREDPRSMLSLFQGLIELRRKLPMPTIGSYRPLNTGDGSIAAYLREHDGRRVLVVLNFGAEHRTLDLSAAGNEGEILCSTRLNRTGSLDLSQLHVRSHEGILASLTSKV